MIRTLHRVVSLLAVTAAAALVALPATAGRSTASATTVTVKAVELKFTLSTKTVSAGAVTFKITNKGHLAHDFWIANKKTPLIQPGKTATLKVTLKKGKYPYKCTVAGHAAGGMKGVLTVK